MCRSTFSLNGPQYQGNPNTHSLTRSQQLLCSGCSSGHAMIRDLTHPKPAAAEGHEQRGQGVCLERCVELVVGCVPVSRGGAHLAS